MYYKVCWPGCAAEDTHLHASFQQLMEQTEVSVAHEKRKEDPNRVPKLSRQDVSDVVREVPLTIQSTQSQQYVRTWAAWGLGFLRANLGCSGAGFS